MIADVMTPAIGTNTAFRFNEPKLSHAGARDVNRVAERQRLPGIGCSALLGHALNLLKVVNKQGINHLMHLISRNIPERLEEVNSAGEQAKEFPCP